MKSLTDIVELSYTTTLDLKLLTEEETGTLASTYWGDAGISRSVAKIIHDKTSAFCLSL